MLVTIAMLCSTCAQPASVPEDERPQFAAPERLLADGQPINAVEGMPYPSPVLFDVDGDGRDELICGDLWGYLWVYENSASKGDPQWGAAAKLESDDEVIQVSNW